MRRGPDPLDSAEPGGPPRQSLLRLFMRFLRFGLLAWGGPVAQIAMLRHSLVDEQRWISSERFNRTLAVYQALPGPEAQELTVFFGMLARGRIGGLLTGLAFLLPGFVLMVALSWAYLEFGIDSPVVVAAFAGCQAAVVALVVRGVHRIGERSITTVVLLVIAVLAFAAGLASVHFAITLGVGGLAYLFWSRGRVDVAILAMTALLGATAVLLASPSPTSAPPDAGQPPTIAIGQVAPIDLLASGLKAGSLSFGGAYTAIPFVREDAVGADGWMTDRQFLDGLALGGVLPAPMVMFATFVGYAGGGPLGALAITIGMFLPAFAITLIGHQALERVVDDRRFHGLLDGVTAAVVGLVAATTLQLGFAALTSLPAALIFGLALVTLYVWRAPIAVLGVIGSAALLGILLLA